jgi:hypothetical protein
MEHKNVFKWMFVLMFIIVSSSFAFAEATPVVHLDLSNLVDLTGNGNDASVNSGSPTSITSYPSYSISGSSSPNSTNMPEGSTIGILDSPDFDFGNDMGVCLWYYSWSIGSEVDTIIAKDGGSGTNSAEFNLRVNGYSSKKFEFIFGNGASTRTVSSNVGITTGVWTHICGVKNSTSNQASLYINGVKQTSTQTLYSYTSSGNIRVNAETSGGNQGKGYYDEIWIFNGTPTQTQIENLFNYGNLNGPPPALELNNVTSYPRIATLESDLGTSFIPTYEDLGYGVDITITWYKNSSGVVTNVNTYDYTWLNSTLTSGVVVNTTIGQGMVTETLTDGDYWWSEITLFQYDSPTTWNELSVNSTEINVDVTFPSITLNPSNGFSTNNDTIISGYKYDLPINITFNDLNLFAAMINITCDVDGVIYNWNETNIGGQTYTQADTIDLNGYVPQKCTINLEASDEHTAELIPKYNVREDYKKLGFKTEANNDIEIETTDSARVDTKKNFDRYNFNFKYNDNKLKRDYYVRADNPIYFIEDSEYPAHFVVWNYEINRGNWIDFDLPDKNKYTYSVDKISNNEYKVTIESIVDETKLTPKKKGPLSFIGIGQDMTREELIEDTFALDDVTFNSIGGTNIYSASYEFYIGGLINVTGINIYDNSFINTYNVSVTQTSGTLPFSGVFSSVGSNLQIENVTNGTFNLQFNSPDTFTQTETGLVLNSGVKNINYSSYEHILTLQSRNIKTGVFLLNVNYTLVDGSFTSNYNSNGNTSYKVYVNATTFVATANASGYDEVNENITTTLKGTSTYIFDMPFIATFRLIDERTLEPFNISSPDTIRFLLICPDSTFTTIITEQNQSIPINCDYTKFKFTLEYGSTSYYRTQLIEPNDAFDVNVYLIDLDTTQAIFNNFVVDDLLADYTNVSIYIYKTIGNATDVITADFIDLEDKIGAYLIENNEYIVELRSTNQPTQSLGTYGASQTGSIYLRLYDFGLDPSTNNLYDRIYYNQWADKTNSTLMLYSIINDSNSLLTNINWTLYKDSITGDVLYTVSSTQDNIVLMYNATSNINDTIIGKLTITTPESSTGGFIDVRYLNQDNKVNLDIQGYLSQNFFNWMFIILLGTLALYATIKTANPLSLLLVGGAGMLNLFGLFTLSSVTIAIAGLVSFISLLKDVGRTSGEFQQ